LSFDFGYDGERMREMCWGFHPYYASPHPEVGQTPIINNPGAVPAPDPSLPFLCADKGKEAKENRPTQSARFSKQLGSGTRLRIAPPRLPIHSSMVQGRVGILPPSLRLTARKSCAWIAMGDDKDKGRS